MNIKLSKNDWERMGKESGYFKKAYSQGGLSTDLGNLKQDIELGMQWIDKVIDAGRKGEKVEGSGLSRSDVEKMRSHWSEFMVLLQKHPGSGLNSP